MKKSRFNEEQIIGILREADGQSSIKSVCAKHNVSEATFYTWKKKYSGMDVAEARRLRALEEENRRLKEPGGRPGGADPDLQGGERKKMVGPASRRRAVKVVVETGLGNPAQACRALNLARSTFYHAPKPTSKSQQLRRQIVALSRKPPRYGYRRITARLRRSGEQVNAKRVQRIRCREGFQVSRRQRRSQRVGVSTAERPRAARPNDVWSWDFVTDQTENGSHFRILTLIDEYSRACIATHAGWSIRAVDVITVVEAAFARYGRPKHLRSDNGPEFIAGAIQDWLAASQVKTLYIKPGSPWENGHIESFHDKLRGECLNRELFGSLLEAQILLEAWRTEYNDERPHSALRYQTPTEYARQSAAAADAKEEATNPEITRRTPV